MNTGGLSTARLGRMHDIMAGHVERGTVPGILTLVSRGGEVHVDAIGMKALGGTDPIRRDTIFRITSILGRPSWRRPGRPYWPRKRGVPCSREGGSAPVLQ